MRGLWCVALVVSLIYINLASSDESCPRLKKVGCFHDSFRTNADRVFPNELINRRDPMSNNWDRHTISWKAYPQSIKSLACACAKAAKEKGWRYFGLQFFGECWSGPSMNPGRDGPSDKCIGTNYKPCIDNDPKRQCVGKAFTNYVYEIMPAIIYHHPVDGRWAGWSSWSACSKLCNNGKRTRTRTCTNPRPSHGGHQCPGKATDDEGCNQEPCEPKCNSQMDIGIILDASTSVTRKNWEGTLKFVNRLSKIFTIGPDHVKFGIIRFSWFPFMIFGLSNKEYWANEAFENKVSRIRYTYGGTRTDRALQMAEKQLLCEKCGTRKAAHKALLVVTDGIPSQNSAPLDEVTEGLKRRAKCVQRGRSDDMVDFTVLPKNGQSGNYVIWRRKEGKEFALRIAESQHKLITKFIVQNTVGDSPIEASLCMLDQVRPYAAYPILLGDNRKVGFVVGQYFLLISFDMLKASVQEKVGEKIYESKEMMDLIFPETVADED